MSKTQETIQEMARLTMLSNKLNEVQIKNLKMYPFIYFDGIQQIVMDYDFSNNLDVNTEEEVTPATEEEGAKLDIKYDFQTTPEHLYINYHLTLEPTIKQIHLEKRFEALEGSVRALLWKEIVVRVFFGSDKVFESKKHESK